VQISRDETTKKPVRSCRAQCSPGYIPSFSSALNLNPSVFSEEVASSFRNGEKPARVDDTDERAVAYGFFKEEIFSTDNQVFSFDSQLGSYDGVAINIECVPCRRFC